MNYFPAHSIKKNGEMLYEKLEQFSNATSNCDEEVALHIEAHSLGALVTLAALAVAIREDNEAVFDLIKIFALLAPPLNGSPVAEDLSNLTLIEYLLAHFSSDDEPTPLLKDLAQNPSEIIDNEEGSSIGIEEVFHKLSSKGVKLNIYLVSRDVMIKRSGVLSDLLNVKVIKEATHNELVKSPVVFNDLFPA